MSDAVTAGPPEEPAPRRRWATVAVVLVGLVLGGAAGLLVAATDGDERVPASVEEEAPAPTGDPLLDAMLAAGVPEVVATCAADTVADQPAAVQSAVVDAPLGADAPGRLAVSACALEHLATRVEAGAGLAGTDARCVAGEVIDRLGLELVLASIGAVAVTQEVEAAGAAAAETCAAE